MYSHNDVFFLRAVGREVVGLEDDHHADGRAPKEDGAGQRFVILVLHCGFELDEADLGGREFVYGLDGDVLEFVWRLIEFVGWVGLEGEVVSEGCYPVLERTD